MTSSSIAKDGMMPGILGYSSRHTPIPCHPGLGSAFWDDCPAGPDALACLTTSEFVKSPIMGT